MCQSVAVPSSAEYWHIGDTMIRLGSVRPRKRNVGDVMGDLSSRRGMIQGMEDMTGGGKAIRAEVPLAEMFGYSTTLRSLTQGRATYTMEFKHYAEAPKQIAEAVINKYTGKDEKK